MQKCFFWSTSVQVDTSSGDASKARIYIGPQLYDTSANLIPVTLSFVDVNGSHLPDMMLHLQDTRLVSINKNGDSARPSPAKSKQPSTICNIRGNNSPSSRELSLISTEMTLDSYSRLKSTEHFTRGASLRPWPAEP